MSSCGGINKEVKVRSSFQWLKRRCDGEKIMYGKLRSWLRNSCIGLNQKGKVRDSCKGLKQKDKVRNSWEGPKQRRTHARENKYVTCKILASVWYRTGNSRTKLVPGATSPLSAITETEMEFLQAI